MYCEPLRAATASGRNSPWVSEMMPTSVTIHWLDRQLVTDDAHGLGIPSRFSRRRLSASQYVETVPDEIISVRFKVPLAPHVNAGEHFPRSGKHIERSQRVSWLADAAPARQDP